MKLFNTPGSILCLLLTWLSLFSGNVFAMGPEILLLDYHGPVAKSSSEPTTFSFIRNLENKLIKLKGKLTKTINGVDDDNNSIGLNTSYGQLLNSGSSGYLGYALLTGNVDSTNNIRLNSSFSHLIPELDSELLFSYRLFGRNISNNFDSLGFAEDHVYENSFAASYTTYLDSFLREATVFYNYSILPQNDIRNTRYTPTTQDDLNPMLLRCGFGQVERHGIAADIVFGIEEVPVDFISGIKIDLGVDYAHISHDRYYDLASEEVDEVSGLASIEHLTSLGLLKSFYRIGASSSTLYTGLLLGGMELYMTDTSYDDGDRAQVYGLSFNFDLSDVKNAMTPRKRTLFGAAKRQYSDIKQMRHHTSLTSNSFQNAPRLHEVALSLP